MKKKKIKYMAYLDWWSKKWNKGFVINYDCLAKKKKKKLWLFKRQFSCTPVWIKASPTTTKWQLLKLFTLTLTNHEIFLDYSLRGEFLINDLNSCTL